MDIKDKKEAKNFGCMLGGLMVIFSFFKWNVLSLSTKSFLILGASSIFLSAFLYPSLLSPFSKLWLKFGRLLHIILSPILMGSIYYFLITPFSLILRMCGKDSLSLKKSKVDSYWIKQDKSYICNMNNQF